MSLLGDGEAAKVNVIVLTIGLALAFACCVCGIRRCYPRCDEFTSIR